MPGDYDIEEPQEKIIRVKSIDTGKEVFQLPVEVEVKKKADTNALWLEIVKALSQKLEDLIMNPPQVEII